MIQRRTFIKGASVITGCALSGLHSLRSSAAIIAGLGESQPVPNSSGSEPAKLKAPAGACDCHHHIYDAARFPPVEPGGTIIPNARVEE